MVHKNSHVSQNDEASAAALVAGELAARRRRWPALLLGLVVGASGAYGFTAYAGGSTADNTDETLEAVVLSTASVESRDLLEEVEWTGTLQYGEPLTIAGSGGTVTTATPAGTELNRGGVIASVDEEPVAVFYGQRPLWRTLRDGTEGLDVLLLETNLVALGYDPDVTVSVDKEFTANTALMVERWQTDLGREVTGIVEVSDIVLTAGPGVVTTEAIVGSSADQVLATISSQRTVTDVVSGVAGEVTDVAAIGTPIEHMTTMFRVDDVPVLAVTAEAVANDQVLALLTSATYTDLELEEALADEGFDPADEMTIDGVVSEATNAAIERWQQASALPITGLAQPGYYQLMPEGQSVEAHLFDEAGISNLRPVLTASSSELRVEVEVGVADADEFSEGQAVGIELADENLATGTVVEIGQVRRADQQSDPTVTVLIDVSADADQALVEGNVTVTTISNAIEGATAVPTRALVSLSEGGFAVEVAEADGSTRLIGVDLGTFDDGYVQVTNDAVAVGDELVVPQ